MNVLEATITGIESSNHLSLVDLQVQGDPVAVVIVETEDTADYLKAGNRVAVTFKETEVALSRDPSVSISLRNRFSCTVVRINEGRILTAIDVDYKGTPIQSIMTTRSARELSLAPGDKVTALVKTNELSLIQR